MDPSGLQLLQNMGFDRAVAAEALKQVSQAAHWSAICPNCANLFCGQLLNWTTQRNGRVSVLLLGGCPWACAHAFHTCQSGVWIQTFGAKWDSSDILESTGESVVRPTPSWFEFHLKGA